MTYTGDVAPGGPSDQRVLDAVVVRKASVGPHDNNAYLLTCRATGAQVLVDAAAEPERLLALIKEGSGSARLDLVVTTHRHPDHHGALRSVVALTGAQTVAGALDVDGIDVPTVQAVRNGAFLHVGELRLGVIALRGHTPGSIAIGFREPAEVAEPEAVPRRVHLFTGDSLFPGGLGNTGGDQERFDQLYDDVLVRVFDEFEDDTWIYPGHGADTTLGAERPHLDAWRERGW